VTQVYAKRRTAFDQALAATFGGAIDYRVPDGGLAFWLRFADPALLDRIEAGAPAHGLSLATSASFATTDDAPRGLRLGFASLTEAEAVRALTSLAAAGGTPAAGSSAGDRHALVPSTS
jgi:GntR family transcriptional regulator/MocR family aminotransferase